MSDATPTPEPTGQAPATPGASAPEPPQAQEGTLLTGSPPVTAEPAADPAKPAEPVAPVIPDKYEFKAPEGMELDTELLDAIAPTFKELGLTQDNAAKLVDSFNTIMPKLAAAREAKAEADFIESMAVASKNNIAAIKKEWGNQFDTNMPIAQRGIARFMSAEGKKILEDTGLGNHPEFIKAFYQAGKMIQEDQPPLAGKPPANGASKLFTKSLGVN